MMRKLTGFAIVAFLWSAFLFGAGWITHAYFDQTAVSATPQVIDAGSNPLLDEVWEYVRTSFVGEVPSDTVRNYGAVRGALATLNDRWTMLVEPQPRSLERDNLRGQFGGIGVEISVNEQGQIVLTPNIDSPAERAGVLAGDILVAIDGIPLPDKPIFDEIPPQVRGEVGSVVRISVRRGARVLDFSITRTIIQIPSVEWRIISGTQQSGHVGYVAIHRFTERTASEVKQAIAELRQAGSQAYLIDLRDNGGGLLDAAVGVASQFLEDGIVLIERTRDNPDDPISVTTDNTARAFNEPLVVLINGNTASASEIVAGAIQDRQRGKLIGEKSFGKGSVQTIYDLSDGSSAHITSAQWFTPNRRAIEGVGLTPDIVVTREAEQDNDPQLDRALAELRATASK